MKDQLVALMTDVLNLFQSGPAVDTRHITNA